MAKKSYSHRFKVTKTGKVMRRTQGLTHAKANKSGNTIRRRRNIGKSADVDRTKFINRTK